MQNCDQCRFGEMREVGSTIKLLCAHAHVPPFIAPDWDQIESGEWGWMLRCKDFKRAQAVAPLPNPQHESQRRDAQRIWRIQGADISRLQTAPQ